MTTATAEKVVELALSKCVHHPDNPRPAKAYAKKALEGLATAIKANGCDPLIGRMLDGKFEVCAGNRRLEAVELNGAKTVPVIIREMNDFEALCLVLANNGQHESPDPFLEARAIGKLLKEEGATLESVASGIGVSVRTVARRRELLNLAPSIMQAYQEPESAISRWPVSWLEVVVQLSPAVQEVWFNTEHPQHFRIQDEVEKSVANYLRDLGKAPWDVNDATLYAKAGACTGCPKQSQNAPGLFGTIKGAGDVSKATCRDAICWKAKLDRHAKQQVAAVIEKNPDVTILKAGNPGYWQSGSDKLERGSVKTPGGFDALDANQWKPCAKDDKGAKLGVLVSGPAAGKKQWFKKTGESSNRSYMGGYEPKEPSKKEKLARLEDDLAKQRAQNFADEAHETIKGAKDVDARDVLALACVVGMNRHEWKVARKAYADGLLKSHESLKAWGEHAWTLVRGAALAALQERWNIGTEERRELARICLGVVLDETEVTALEEKCDAEIKESEELLALRAEVAAKPEKKSKKGKGKKDEAPVEDAEDQDDDEAGA